MKIRPGGEWPSRRLYTSAAERGGPRSDPKPKIVLDMGCSRPDRGREQPGRWLTLQPEGDDGIAEGRVGGRTAKGVGDVFTVIDHVGDRRGRGAARAGNGQGVEG